jgi:hypothetical protein
MKVNFKINLNGHKGEPIGMMDEQLRRVLFSVDTNERLPISADEKYLAYKIGKRLFDCNGEIELTVEDAAFLKKVCAAWLVAGAYGQLVDLIEGGK